MSSPLKIAIIGAGPAGCMVARLLHNENIDVTIFEGETVPRMYGGSLDLHTETGLAAMKKAGLYEDFLKYARFDGESFQITDRKLVRLIDLAGTDAKSSRGRPEIDRPALRKILIDSLPKDVINWGWKLRTVDNDLTLHFDQGTKKGYDLIIGGDGTWSKVRPLLSDAAPYYSGISGYIFELPDAEHNDPALYNLVRRGSLFAWGSGRAITAQQMGIGVVNTAAWITTPSTEGIHDEVAAKAYLKDQFAGWDPELVRLTQHEDSTNFVFRPLFMLPVGHRWKHRPGVTLLGDAAHVMTPFAGEGVNLALEDAMKLADAIIEASKVKSEDDGKGAALSNFIKRFEEDMFKRATKTQQMTVDMQEAMLFTPGAPWANVEKYILTAARDEVPQLALPLLTVAVYVYFFFLRLWKKPKDV